MHTKKVVYSIERPDGTWFSSPLRDEQDARDAAEIAESRDAVAIELSWLDKAGRACLDTVPRQCLLGGRAVEDIQADLLSKMK